MRLGRHLLAAPGPARIVLPDARSLYAKVTGEILDKECKVRKARFQLGRFVKRARIGGIGAAARAQRDMHAARQAEVVGGWCSLMHLRVLQARLRLKAIP